MKLRLKGLAELNRKIDKIGRDITPEIEASTKHAVLYVQGEWPAYPAPPPGSTYRRTETLGRSVTSMAGQAEGALARVETVGSTVVGVVGTKVVYAPFVIDEHRQAWMHRGRWETLQNTVRGAYQGIKRIYEDMVSRLVRTS